ncbi:hypothetical protein [Psychroflexus aestuariivivens]|uniref:hypothetical protein n=1 Tax=Psychroflexus aestuariivivens TaxID=1795040 RepID=UPI000FDB6F36|nr:hypothetical protein [Psychroflexus aestuariivivens]
MSINPLKEPGNIQNKRLTDFYRQFDKLLIELRKKELNTDVVNSINNGIEEINAFSGSEKKLRKKIKTEQSRILKLIEKEHKLVTKNHYRNMWLAIGMAAFGIPLGVAFGASLGNMAFISIGLPIGLAVGIAVGTELDKKAFEKDKQIDLEIKY